MAAPWIKRTGCRIVHLVRHPARVINSFCNYLHYFYDPANPSPPALVYERFIYRHLPELREPMSQYERAALYYVLWNEMIESQSPDCFARIEDAPGSLLWVLNEKPVSGMFVDQEINSFAKPGTRFSMSDLPDGSIRRRLIDMGERYGYRTSLDYLVL